MYVSVSISMAGEKVTWVVYIITNPLILNVEVNYTYDLFLALRKATYRCRIRHRDTDEHKITRSEKLSSDTELVGSQQAPHYS